MSENLLKSYIQNLDYDNIKFIILQGSINIESDELKGNDDPLIILLKPFRLPELHEKISLILRYLINSGFNIHGSDSLHNTPIHYAMKNGYIESISILLQNKANLTIKNNYGLTPIMLALEIKKKDLKDLIIAREFIDDETLDEDVKQKEMLELNNKLIQFVKDNFLSSDYTNLNNFIEKIAQFTFNNEFDNIEKNLFDKNQVYNKDNFRLDTAKKLIEKMLQHTDFEKMKYSQFLDPDKRYRTFYGKEMQGGRGNTSTPTRNHLQETIDAYNNLLGAIFIDYEGQVFNYLLDDTSNIDD
jgi:hypothetical protein